MLYVAVFVLFFFVLVCANKRVHYICVIDVMMYVFTPSCDCCLSFVSAELRTVACSCRRRTRGHQFELPAIKYEFNKLNFIVRSLFNYV